MLNWPGQPYPLGATFNGSGTTRIVANKLGRNAIGFELNPQYIEIENRRRSKELGIFESITL